MEKFENECSTPEAILSLVRPQLMDPFTRERELSFDEGRRLKLWEIEGIFKCPVVGWCLEFTEQKEC